MKDLDAGYLLFCLNFAELVFVIFLNCKSSLYHDLVTKLCSVDYSLKTVLILLAKMLYPQL